MHTCHAEKLQQRLVGRRRAIKAGSSIALAAVSGFPMLAKAAPLFENILMFVPAAPGGGWDGTARSIEKAARDAGLVGSFQFENVGGAAGMVGLPRFVNQRKGMANALMVGGSVMVGGGITNKSPVTIKDVTPLARLTEETGVLVVPANSAIKTFKDFEQALKTNPKAVSVAGGSAGGTDHILLGMMLKAVGKNPREAAYVAFAENKILFAVGENARQIIGNALKATPVSGAMMEFELSFLKASGLMTKQFSKAREVAEKIFKETPEADKIKYSLSAGEKLSLKVGIKSPVLGFMKAAGEEAKK